MSFSQLEKGQTVWRTSKETHCPDLGTQSIKQVLYVRKGTGKLRHNWKAIASFSWLEGAYSLEDHEGNLLPKPWDATHLKRYYM